MMMLCVMEALILAGSSELSFYEQFVVQAGLKAARRVSEGLSGLGLTAVCIVFYTLWLFMSTYRGIVVCYLFLGCLNVCRCPGRRLEPNAWMKSPVLVSWERRGLHNDHLPPWS